VVHEYTLRPTAALTACPNVARFMSESISTAELLKCDLSRHTPMMAQYLRINADFPETKGLKAALRATSASSCSTSSPACGCGGGEPIAARSVAKEGPHQVGGHRYTEDHGHAPVGMAQTQRVADQARPGAGLACHAQALQQGRALQHQAARFGALAHGVDVGECGVHQRGVDPAAGPLPGSAMGAHVNSLGFDADDDKALAVLAKRYGYTRVEILKSEDIGNGTYRFDTDARILASLSSNQFALRVMNDWGLADSATGTSKHSPTDVFGHSSLRSAEWHVIYGSSDARNNVTWVDKQKRYPKGPSGALVAICFIKR